MNSKPLDPRVPAGPADGPRYVRVLSIAGSDSGGGAGIQADLKTFAALGCFGMTAITAITAQNTQGVRSIHGIPPAMLRDQIDAVVEDIGVDAVKIGMLHAPGIAEVVADAIRRHALPNVVLDPVMVATSGDRLIAPDTVAVLVDALFPLAAVVTPNLDEAGMLLGRRIADEAAMETAAQDLLALGANAVLLKGGHLPGDALVDLLARQGGAQPLHLRAARVGTRNGHGTGCTLSSAIAAHLAIGLALPDAVAAAHAYVQAAIQAGARVRTGRGSGPLDHGHAPVVQRIAEHAWA